MMCQPARVLFVGKTLNKPLGLVGLPRQGCFIPVTPKTLFLTLILVYIYMRLDLVIGCQKEFIFTLDLEWTTLKFLPKTVMYVDILLMRLKVLDCVGMCLSTD